MVTFRYLAVFLVPVVAAVSLFYATTPWRAEAVRLSLEFLDLAMRMDAEALAQRILQEPEAGERSRLYHLIRVWAVGTILVTGCLAGLFFRVEDSVGRVVNLLTVLAAGFGVAHLVVRFGFIGWAEFGLWVAVALVLAACVPWARGEMMRRWVRR